MKNNNILTHYEDGLTPMNIITQRGILLGDSSQIVFRVNKNIGSLISILSFILCDDGS